MAVTNQTPINRYAANGVTTVFPYTFLILAAADLKVTVDGVTKALTTDYTVSGTGTPSGGNVTFLSAPASGTTVVIKRNMAYKRDTDYQDNGDLLADTLNPDQDEPVLMIQQIAAAVLLALRAPDTDSASLNMELPVAASRASKFLAFDAAGQPIASDSGITGVPADASAIVFTPAGTGATARTVQSKLRDVVSVKDFGAAGDGVTDDTAAIQAAINASWVNILYFPPGTYKTTSKITTPYGKNIKLFGGTIYGGAAIKAYHSDHVFQYGFTIQIDGVGFYRDSSFAAAAKAGLKGGIYSDDTGGAISGAAYTRVENCVVDGNHYVGIRMHGTHQIAINNTANGCTVGMWLLGSVHTLIHNSTENNTLTALLIDSNGSRVLSHYADGNCASGTAGYGVVTITGAYNQVSGLEMNNNNGAQHFYVTGKNNWFGHSYTYASTEFPRVTVTSFANTFTAPVIATVSGGDGYQNFFHPRTSYASGSSFNDFGPVYSLEGYAQTIPAGGTNYILSGSSPVAAAISAQYVLATSFVSLLKQGKIDVLGVTVSANNSGTSNSIAGTIKVRDTTANADLATLISFSGNEQWGWSQSAEGANPTTALASIPINSSSSYPIYLTNTGETIIHNFYYKIIYRIKSSGTYA